MMLADVLTMIGISLAVSVAVVTLVLLVWSLMWVYQDAEARGKPGWAVALVVLFLKWPLSLLLWLIFRPQPTLPCKSHARQS